MIEFSNEQIQESPFGPTLRINLKSVVENIFFSRLARERVSLPGYQLLTREKYSSISYFVGFLEAAERSLKPISPELADVITANRLDEIGFFAGHVRIEYCHETWRLRALELIGAAGSDNNGMQVDSSSKHHAIMQNFSKIQQCV